MNNRTLGLIGIAAAPFLLMDVLTGGFNPNHHTSLMGFLSLIYMIGWMSSLFALKRMNAFGTSKLGTVVYYMQMLFLTLAQGWNTYVIVDPGAFTPLYNFLDMFWPISNFFMLVTGLTIVFAKKLEGWKKFTPLLVGLWLPLSVLFWSVLGHTTTTLAFTGVYSAITWGLMGLSVWLHAKENESAFKNDESIKEKRAFAGV